MPHLQYHSYIGGLWCFVDILVQFINNNELIRNMTPKEISDAQDKLLAEIRETQKKLDSIR